MLKNKLKNKKKKGFTLIELIVVLAVLAIIALIAIPNFNSIRENSKVKSDQRSAEIIDKAVTTLVLEGDKIKNNGTYTYNGIAVVQEALEDKTNVKPKVDEATNILAILDGAKVQQSIVSDTDGKFDIEIKDITTAAPKVVVTVGGIATK